MSAFNVVTVTTACPGCQSPVPVRIQFKYGNTWQYEYKVGNRLKWGGNDIGKPGYRRVVVDGVAEKCPNCGYNDERNFYVFVEHDVIKAVEPASNRYDFAQARQTYIVLEE
jgi:hypothetical protein